MRFLRKLQILAFLVFEAFCAATAEFWLLFYLNLVKVDIYVIYKVCEPLQEL